MNKGHLIEAVAHRAGVPVSAAAPMVEAVLDAIAQELAVGGSVSVTNFGTFETTQRASRTARNPSTGAAVQVPATTGVRFRAGGRLKDIVAGASELPATGSAIVKAPKGTRSGGTR